MSPTVCCHSLVTRHPHASATGLVVTLLLLVYMYSEPRAISSLSASSASQTSSSTDWATVMEERRRRLMESCKYQTTKWNKLYKRYTLHAPSAKALYCAVPKVGSSFMKRVIAVIAEDNSQPANPLDINGKHIHDYVMEKHLTLKTSEFDVGLDSATKINQEYSNYIKITFTRDPFQKVFSAYVDKVYRTFIEGTNRKILQGTSSRTSGKTPVPPISLLNVSFSQTLEYVISGRSTSDEHYLSQHVFCDVCHVNYDVIGKMDTFNDDVEYFLTSVNRSGVFKAMGNIDSNNARKIVIDTVATTFERTITQRRSCHFKDVLLRRVWSMFQIRGYISDDAKFPFINSDETCPVRRSEFEELVLIALSNSGIGAAASGALKAQKKNYFLQAFRSVPLSVLKRYRDHVRVDCQLFEYDCSPPELFQGRREGDEIENVFSDIKYMYAK